MARTSTPTTGDDFMYGDYQSSPASRNHLRRVSSSSTLLEMSEREKEVEAMTNRVDG
ncbi:hypothetical protein LINGRAHAP2_LOCUS23152, partial [Linum grandiflorum]